MILGGVSGAHTTQNHYILRTTQIASLYAFEIRLQSSEDFGVEGRIQQIGGSGTLQIAETDWISDEQKTS